MTALLWGLGAALVLFGAVMEGRFRRMARAAEQACTSPRVAALADGPEEDGV